MALKVVDVKLVFITIYVDDLILFASTKALTRQMKQLPIDRCAMKDLSELHYILG